MASRPTPRWVRWVVSVATTAGMLATLAAVQMVTAPAASALNLADRPPSNSPVNSLADKSVDTFCTGAARAIAVGGQVLTPTGAVDTSGEVFLTGLAPIGVGTTVFSTRATASEDASYSAEWQVQAQAVCATGLDNFEVVSDVTDHDTEAVKNLTVTCPPGTQVLSGGARTNDTNARDAFIRRIQPSSQGVTAAARFHGPTQGNAWSLTVFAFCTTEPDLTYVTGPLLTSTANVKARTAHCPDGQRVYGMGYRIFQSSQHINLSQMVSSDFSVFVTAQRAEDGGTDDWGLRAFAVCGP